MEEAESSLMQQSRCPFQQERNQRLIDALSATYVRVRVQRMLFSDASSPADEQDDDTCTSTGTRTRTAADDHSTFQQWEDWAVRQVQQRLYSGNNHDEETEEQQQHVLLAQHIVARAQEKAKVAFAVAEQQPTGGSSSSTLGNTKPATTAVTAAAPTSFSLLDQFAASPPFFWSALPDPTTNIPETLALLHKVEYLEDVFPDWEVSIRPFLRDNLLVVSQHGVDPSRILDLYATWYTKVRAASSDFESKTLACDIVCDLLGFAQQQSGTRTTCMVAATPTTKSSLQLAMDMFLDMMTHGSFPAQRIDPIGETLYSFFSSALYTVVRDVDPYAQCLRHWIPASCRRTRTTTTTVLVLLPLLKSQPTILPQILAHIGCQQQQEQQDLYALSTVRSILVATRVQEFPWVQLATTPSQVLGLFLEGLLSRVTVVQNDDPVDETAIAIYMEALDTIHSGLLSFDTDQRREALREQQETIQRILSQLQSGSRHALAHHVFPLGTLPSLLHGLLLLPP